MPRKNFRRRWGNAARAVPSGIPGFTKFLEGKAKKYRHLPRHEQYYPLVRDAQKYFIERLDLPEKRKKLARQVAEDNTRLMEIMQQVEKLGYVAARDYREMCKIFSRDIFLYFREQRRHMTEEERREFRSASRTLRLIVADAKRSSPLELVEVDKAFFKHGLMLNANSLILAFGKELKKYLALIDWGLWAINKETRKRK